MCQELQLKIVLQVTSIKRGYQFANETEVCEWGKSQEGVAAEGIRPIRRSIHYGALLLQFCSKDLRPKVWHRCL